VSGVSVHICCFRAVTDGPVCTMVWLCVRLWLCFSEHLLKNKKPRPWAILCLLLFQGQSKSPWQLCQANTSPSAPVAAWGCSEIMVWVSSQRVKNRTLYWALLNYVSLKNILKICWDCGWSSVVKCLSSMQEILVWSQAQQKTPKTNRQTNPKSANPRILDTFNLSIYNIYYASQ
jgi:hypothetical protein